MKIVTAIPVKHTPDHVAPEILEQEDPDTLYIENTSDVPSLCSKLNTALEWAKEKGADWLCFHHDDLEIQTHELVELNLRKAYTDGCRVCGVIGSLILNTPQWWMNNRPLMTWGAIIQGYKDGREQLMADQPGYNPNMVIVDGCVLWIHKEMFDERVADYGMHLYDDDLCLRALQKGYKVACIDVRCRHQSEGGYEFRDYQGVADKFMEYWRQRAEMPIISGQKFKEV